MKSYTFADTLGMINEIIADSGETYVCPRRSGSSGCYYAWEGQPDCIVGHLMHRIGAFDVRLHETDRIERTRLSGLWTDSYIGSQFSQLELTADVQFTRKAQAFLSELQMQQDEQIPWGRARDMAIEYVESAYFGDTF